MFWDPVVTAPKDGSRVLLLYHNDIVCCGFYDRGWIPDLHHLILDKQYPIMWQRIPDIPHQEAIKWHRAKR